MLKSKEREWEVREGKWAPRRKSWGWGKWVVPQESAPGLPKWERNLVSASEDSCPSGPTVSSKSLI